MTQTSISQDLRMLLAFGSGVGIEIGATDLEVVAARVRPSRIRVLGRLTIRNFATRPAAEWGAEYARFLKSLGASRLSATVLLPRREVIVRQVALPGVSSKDIDGALRFQLESLHPYGEDGAVSWGWSPLDTAGTVLVGIARQEAVERYIEMFTEAGIAVASFTFAAAAVHAAVRLNGAASSDGGFVALGRTATGAVEVYGESAARPVFSAEFDLAPERAAALALSELRLPAGTAPRKLEEVLPKPFANPLANDLSRNALPYATALAGACSRLAPSANVLPPEHRRLNSRAVFVPTAVLAVLLLLVAFGTWGYSKYAEHRYLRKIEAEIVRLEPMERRAAQLDRDIALTRARTLLLDQFRNQTRADLDTMNELTRLIEPPAWTTGALIARDSVRIQGEAPQAAPLVRILDSSPFFADTVLDNGMRSANGESFQMHAARRENHR